jgi:hypothetical protein
MSETPARTDPNLIPVAVSMAAMFAIASSAYALAPAISYGSLLVAGLFGASLCLGGATLVAFCGLTGASWWTPIRRVPMALGLLLPVPLLAVAVALFAGTSTLFSWADPQHVAASSILQAKSAWLSTPFFLVRALVIMALWIVTIGALRRALAGTIKDATHHAIGRLKRSAAVFLVVLAPTLSVASWDWAMSLEPEWFSTMYGVYLFSGAVLGGLAAVSAVLTMPAAERLFGRRVDRDVLHNLGQLLFGFSAFWAYIWFCQYMLIWYANIPEEATYFALRFDMRWATLFWLVPALSFVVPFVVLMSAAAKRSRAAMFQVSLVVLLGRWVDVYVMVWPPLEGPAGFPYVAIATSLAMLLAMRFAWPRAVTATRGKQDLSGPSVAPPGWAPEADAR